ncbi:MAG: hypothetical protein U9Q00_05315 [Synergistota bacterium]|nr:hypothetical protein [Synergistota bacterium]
MYSSLYRIILDQISKIEPLGPGHILIAPCVSLKRLVHFIGDLLFLAKIGDFRLIFL